MNYAQIIFVIICFASCLRTAAAHDLRVLLMQLSHSSEPQFFRLESSSKFTISSSELPRKKMELPAGNLFGSTIGGHNYLCYGNNADQIRTSEMHLTTANNHFTLNGITYKGRLSIIADHRHHTTQIINTVSLDDYLYSVLRSETFQSWPLEMHKVQAIASRTYALYHMQESRKAGLRYDIKNSNFHQCYNGHHDYTHLRKALDETKNLVLTHKGKLALTMFDACCGGSIPAKMNHATVKETPCLARTEACTYCKKCPVYSWKKTIDADEFLNLLNKDVDLKRHLTRLGTLKDVKISEKDPTGLVQEVHLRGNRKSVNFPGTQITSALKPLAKSRTFSLSYKTSGSQKNITITGRGFGHQLGLCQYGARELVRRGWSMRRILYFYYPGTHIASVNV